MSKKLYTIHVEDKHLCTSYDIKASDAAEAKTKAKEKFIKEFYDQRKVKTSVTDKNEIL